MTSRSSLALHIILITGVYFGLSSFGGLLGWKILYPIRLFVTFLHEFGHAAGALITGGAVAVSYTHLTLPTIYSV